MNILNRIVSDTRASHDAHVEEARGVNLGDVLVLLMGGALFVYTGYQSWRFLTAHTADDFSIVPLAGLWGLDFGFITWSLVWMHYAKAREQDWVALTLAALDFMGIVLTVLLENVSDFIPPELKPVATFSVYVIILANVIAAAAYHAVSPETQLGRLRRKAVVELEQQRQVAQNLLAAERLQAEYAQRILEQRDQLIDLKEKMARQKVVLDGRDNDLMRLLQLKPPMPRALPPTTARTARQNAMTVTMPAELQDALAKKPRRKRKPKPLKTNE